MVTLVPDKELITHLNGVLKNKLTGINQYFLHARMLKYMGNVKLADYEYKSSIDIMKHSDMLVELILTLGGFPNLQDLSKLSIGETVPEMLKSDLNLSRDTLKTINTALHFIDGKPATKEAQATATVLQKILEGQQEHIDFINTQLMALAPENPQKKESA